MNIKDIQNPSFLKEMNVRELEGLAEEIRSFLIQNISRTGGHLASNLGVVELTIALHYVFNSPQDKMLFDVGHQSYVHKILTGRASQFPTLRQYHGLSGFQKRSESVHDVWEAGHSSTSLSAALGMAVARDLKDDDYEVIPIIGDGALSSGMSMEALNEIGSEGKRMIIVFNDNNMSISKNVGALTSSFSKLRSSSGYTKMKQNMRRSLTTNEFGRQVYSGLRSLRDSIKNTVIDKGIFSEFNLDYIGPIDGHNLHDLIQVFNAVKNHSGPIVVHVITKKGKGYMPCENDREGVWHAVGPFKPDTGVPINSKPEGSAAWAQIVADEVYELALKNQKIVTLTPAMINGSHLQKFFASFPERSFDTGIAEEHAATFAAGLAVDGMRPYLCIYSSFLQRCYDQINHDIARMDLPVVIGVDHTGLVGADGETHHGIFDVSLLTGLPNMIVSHPHDGEEAKDLVYTAFHQNHPFAIRFPKGFTPLQHSESRNLIPIGSWQKYNDHPDNKIVVFTYGENVDKVLDKVVVNQLPVTVVNCRFLKPMDYEMLEELCQREDIHYISYESDMKEHGLGSMILEWANDNGYSIHIQRLGIPDQYVSQGSERLLRRELHIDLNTLLNLIEKELR